MLAANALAIEDGCYDGYTEEYLTGVLEEIIENQPQPTDYSIGPYFAHAFWDRGEDEYDFVEINACQGVSAVAGRTVRPETPSDIGSVFETAIELAMAHMPADDKRVFLDGLENGDFASELHTDIEGRTDDYVYIAHPSGYDLVISHTVEGNHETISVSWLLEELAPPSTVR